MTELSRIFGPESKGGTAQERAKTSSRMFVRSQVQLALDSPEATGRRITALEALDAYGLELLEQVVEDGGVGLVTNPSEPSQTIAERRRAMRLSKRVVASEAGVSVDDLTNAETAGAVIPIRGLENIAQVLALDERRLGLSGIGHGDNELALRLRELKQVEERDDEFVAQLAGAAWVIARQTELSEKLSADRNKKSLFRSKSKDYNPPVWEKGYVLAETTRIRLGLDASAPIESVYKLAQDELGIPIIDMELPAEIAGATVLNGSARGVVLNKTGANRNVLVRRMTLAHELCHLLWDPDRELERVRVDESADLGRRQIRDLVEARANAFAVALLAPRAAVLQTHGGQSVYDTVSRIAETFGISPSAAANHVANVCHLDPRDLSRSPTASAAVTRLWDRREIQDNIITGHVPDSRGGRFALLTVQAVRKRLISVDTAAAWLKIDKRLIADLF